MKNKILMRCLIGAPIGLAINYIISVAVSFLFGSGEYWAVVPKLIEDFGNEINAVTVQAVCSIILGAAFGGASAIWKIDNWSLLRQTFTHLAVVSLAMFPIAFFTRWMGHTVTDVLIYFGIFFGIYLFIWTVQYRAMKVRIKKINEKLSMQTRNRCD